MIMALDPEDGKRLYENLDHIAGEGHGDALADMVLAITGLEVNDHGDVVLDPSTRDDANRVLARWLRDNGHLPRRGKGRTFVKQT
jgi:hypothetical protein